MSQPNSAESEGVQAFEKQPLNVYTVMLVIALICIFMSVLLLYLELRQWGSPPWWKTSGATSAVQRMETAPWYAAIPASPAELKHFA